MGKEGRIMLLFMRNLSTEIQVEKEVSSRFQGVFSCQETTPCMRMSKRRKPVRGTNRRENRHQEVKFYTLLLLVSLAMGNMQT